MNEKHDIICIGMALVDSIIRGFDPEPVSASGFRAESCSLNVGGEAVNESLAAAKLGMKAGIICAIGKDAAGRLIEQELTKAGVDTKTAPFSFPPTRSRQRMPPEPGIISWQALLSQSLREAASKRR